MGGTVGVGVSFTESENFKFFDLKNPKKTGGLDMSEKVYGISGKNKGRVEVIAKGDLLIIEGYDGDVPAKSVKGKTYSAGSTIPDYDGGNNPKKDGFAAYSVLSVQQSIPNNPEHWTDCLNTSGIPYPKVQYNYSGLTVYISNDSAYGCEIYYRVVLLKVK